MEVWPWDRLWPFFSKPTTCLPINFIPMLFYRAMYLWEVFGLVLLVVAWAEKLACAGPQVQCLNVFQACSKLDTLILLRIPANFYYVFRKNSFDLSASAIGYNLPYVLVNLHMELVNHHLNNFPKIKVPEITPINRACSWVSHNALFRNSQTRSVNDSL